MINNNQKQYKTKRYTLTSKWYIARSKQLLTEGSLCSTETPVTQHLLLYSQCSAHAIFKKKESHTNLLTLKKLRLWKKTLHFTTSFWNLETHPQTEDCLTLLNPQWQCNSSCNSSSVAALVFSPIQFGVVLSLSLLLVPQLQALERLDIVDVFQSFPSSSQLYELWETSHPPRSNGRERERDRERERNECGDAAAEREMWVKAWKGWKEKDDGSLECRAEGEWRMEEMSERGGDETKQVKHNQWNVTFHKFSTIKLYVPLLAWYSE